MGIINQVILRKSFEPDIAKEMLDKFERAKTISERKSALIKLLKCSDFSAKLCLASNSLYESLEHMEERSDVEINRIFISIYKYLHRIIDRATPFGLFSYVEGANLSKNRIALKKSDPEMTIRISQDVLLSIYNEIISEINLYPEAIVSLSPNLTFYGEVINLLVIGENPTYKSGAMVSYIKTGSMKEIIDCLQAGSISLEKLVAIVLRKSEEAKIGEVVSDLKLLLKDRVIYTNLYMSKSLYLDDFKSYVDYIKQMSHTKALSNKLISFIDEINVFSEKSDADSFKKLRESSKLYFNIIKPIVVDLVSKKNNQAYLGKMFEEDVNQFVDFLNRMEIKNDDDELMEFYDLFLEKYGRTRIV